jgi:N-acetylglucosamine-6-phosphate deacetylase
MDHAIGNAVRMAGITLREALSMATVNPARICKIAGRQRGLQPGEKADLVRFTWSEASHSLSVVETIVGGTTVYTREQ